jgi:hypothetical protein
LEPYLAEMFLTRFWSIVFTVCSDRLSNKAIIASDWLKFQRSSSPILHGGWNWKLSWMIYSLQGPYQVVLLFVPTALRSRLLLLLKIEISSIVHCCFSISQNELKF